MNSSKTLHAECVKYYNKVTPKHPIGSVWLIPLFTNYSLNIMQVVFIVDVNLDIITYHYATIDSDNQIHDFERDRVINVDDMRDDGKEVTDPELKSKILAFFI